jgi:serine/threonine protein kinase/membrane-associated protease RseP (regulator of RpoE activity)
MTPAVAKIEPGEESFADELKPGARLLLGQFTIDSFLNSGGFGITYLARDSLDRRVVVKECFPSSFCRRTGNAVGPRTRQREEEYRCTVKLFLQEAFNLSKLDHPYIIKVHQVFEDNETAYMAMDYIEGPDLLETVEGKVPPLPPEQIVTLLRKMLEAVGYVHDQGLLHRDISPDNILLNKFTGNPVLIDFGASRKDETRKSRALSGLRVVKDGYSPQEFYIAGSKQAPCSDLYALAASFYHLIAHDTPTTSQERLSAIANREPDPHQPLSGRFPAYPASFLRAIDKAMAIFPRDRIQSVTEWQMMLRDLSEIAAPPASTRRAAVEAASPSAPARSGVAPIVMPPAAALSYPPQPAAAAPVVALPAAAAEPVVAAPFVAAPTAPVAATVPVQPAPQQRVASPSRGSRDILISSAAAMLLLSALLSLPSDLLERFRGSGAPVAVAAAPAEPEVAPVIGALDLHRTVRLAYVADPDDPGLVAAVLPDSPAWMQPGQRIVEVNGQPVQSGEDIPGLLVGKADLSSASALNVILGYEPAPGADIVRKMESLPVVSELRLQGGLTFAIVQTATGPKTIVSAVPLGAGTGLLPGDLVLDYRPTGEIIGTETALRDILVREAGNGVATYSITVQRETNRIEAMFRLSGDA